MFNKALTILENCPGKCDFSCYRCLRSFKNKLEHDLLDRYLGASLLRYILLDEIPKTDIHRLDQTTEILFQDLLRQGIEGIKVEKNKAIKLSKIPEITAPILITRKKDNMSLIVFLYNPLTPGYLPDEGIRQLMEYNTTIPVKLIDELVVRRNLPAATKSIIDELT